MHQQDAEPSTPPLSHPLLGSIEGIFLLDLTEKELMVKSFPFIFDKHRHPPRFDHIIDGDPALGTSRVPMTNGIVDPLLQCRVESVSLLFSERQLGDERTAETQSLVDGILMAFKLEANLLREQLAVTGHPTHLGLCQHEQISQFEWIYQ